MTLCISVCLQDMCSYKMEYLHLYRFDFVDSQSVAECVTSLTIKLRAGDWSTIQFWKLLVLVHYGTVHYRKAFWNKRIRRLVPFLFLTS